MARFSPSGFFGPPGVLSRLLGSPFKYPICAVCVCVCVVHTHTPTDTPTCVKNREDTDNTPIFPSVKNNPPRQATSGFFNVFFVSKKKGKLERCERKQPIISILKHKI